MRWPEAVQILIADRAARLAAEATGRVVDLGVGHGVTFESATALVTLDEAREVDAVVSVGALTAASDLTSLLASIRARLGEAGRVILLEPVADPAVGPVGRLRRILPNGRRPVPSDEPVPHDVLWALWENGFAVTTADHTTLPATAGALRHWVFAFGTRPADAPTRSPAHR